MQAIDVWEIQEWDGGDRHTHKAYVATKEVAEAWKAAHKHDFIRPVLLKIYDSLEDLDANSRKALRKQALAKLTAAEREALGLELDAV